MRTELLVDRVAVVTGASEGIGRAVAAALAREGARVAVAARRAGPLEAAAREMAGEGVDVLPVPADVSRERDVDRLFRRTERELGPVDILVNNAGVLTSRARLVDVPPADWDLSLDANLRSVYLCTRRALRAMIDRRDGRIINLSSGAGKRAAPRWGPYAVAKFGVEGLTRLVAEEVRTAGVTVNAVNPGGTRTRMRAAAYPEEDPAALPAPEELAGIFVYLASRFGRHLTGKSLDWRDWIRSNPGWRAPPYGD